MLKYCIADKYHSERQVSVVYFTNDCITVVVQIESYAIEGESWSVKNQSTNARDAERARNGSS